MGAMGHSHDHDVPARTGRILTAVAASAALLTAVGIVVLRPTGGSADDLRRIGQLGPQFEAVVADVQLAPCPGESTPADILDPICTDVVFRLLSGPDRGRTTSILMPDSPTTPDFEEGEKVMLAYESEAEPGFEYSFVDRHRKPALFWLAVVFSVAVVLLGRLRGLAALAGLAASLVVLLRFVLPALLDGRPPVMVAVVGSAAIAFIALYLAHGLNHMTTVALLGTLASLALTAVLARLFVALTQLSGFASEESVIVKLSAGEIDAAGLVLAGVVIGALGALDDVTVTQASAVWELRAVSPDLTRRRLYRSGLRIGRDHIASTVNTLLLAYAGASLPLLIFFVISQQSLGTVANEEVVATEIVRTLVGSIGLVASVPITTWLATLAAPTRAQEREAAAG